MSEANTLLNKFDALIRGARAMSKYRKDGAYMKTFNKLSEKFAMQLQCELNRLRDVENGTTIRVLSEALIAYAMPNNWCQLGSFRDQWCGPEVQGEDIAQRALENVGIDWEAPNEQ